MADYLPIVVLFVIATGFVFGSFIASGLLGPARRESAAKIGPYECGIITDSEPAERFPVKFYLVAMIFIIFDIEIIFLYPWADRLGTFGLIEMVLFTVAVVVALAYLLSNGALDWGPVAKLRTLEDSLVETRTAASTIRRVSKEQIDSPADRAA
jgi:NADH-quinone oxidoreductase subunit A